MKVPKLSPSARKREPSAFPRCQAPAVRALFRSLMDDGAVESCREGAGFCLAREIDPEHDTRRRQRITEGQRRKFLVIEPCPHRLDGLHEAIFIGELDLDPEHACCPRGQAIALATVLLRYSRRWVSYINVKLIRRDFYSHRRPSHPRNAHGSWRQTRCGAAA